MVDALAAPENQGRFGPHGHVFAGDGVVEGDVLTVGGLKQVEDFGNDLSQPDGLFFGLAPTGGG